MKSGSGGQTMVSSCSVSGWIREAGDAGRDGVDNTNTKGDKSCLKKFPRKCKELVSTKRKKMVCFGAALIIGIVLVATITISVTAFGTNDLTLNNYFETPAKNLFNLSILPEYKLERHTFYVNERDSEEDNEENILIRMPGGPKSPRADGKKPALIQHGIICDGDSCVTNKPKIAIAYILVDQGYDVWLGRTNRSVAENMISTENDERDRLQHVAQYILSATKESELSVMGSFEGSAKFFGMRSSDLKMEEQPQVAKWWDFIPGVKTVKRIYNKGKKYFTSNVDIVVKGINTIGKKIDYASNDSLIQELKKTVLGAWGMVAPTLTIDDYSNMIDHPDVNLDTPQLIKKYGYYPESHQVVTKDGYLLTMHRIAGGEKHPPKLGKPVVLLQHGILVSSSDWVVMGPSSSLGYILSDEGYDVWLGNSRGNIYSRGHVNISTSSPKFWDFSWHEMGVYDLPAMIDYILKDTKQEKISYVGHSQGTTEFFVMLSEKPEYNEKIVSMTAYAPIAYTGHFRSPIIPLLTKFQTSIHYILQLFGLFDFLPTNALLAKIGRDSCESKSVLQIICSNILFLICGYDAPQMNKTMVPVILGHVPAGSSVKQFLHYSQEHKSKKFRQFDLMVPFANMQKYGQSDPPDYNIKNVRIPVALFYGANDLLADNKDVQQLADELPNVSMLYRVPLDHFNHIDFLYAINAPEVVYQPTIKYLETSIRENDL